MGSPNDSRICEGAFDERIRQILPTPRPHSTSSAGRTTMANLDLIGDSTKFRALLANVDMVAPVDSAVLIQGETGTGKEMIARAIHEGSPRRKNRFVALSCAAIPNTLLESELFGCEKGAFTGAVTQTVGRFQAADRGTLFLDEIGDLPLELQPKLLRVLQEKQFERLGGTRTLCADVRIVAATNQDLGRMVKEKTFRADLYYRLNVFPIFLPPLRERRGDVRLLAEHFVRKFSEQQGKTIDEIPEEVMITLEQHCWPGNIRELQNVIERGVIMTTGSVLSCLTTDEVVMAAAEMGGRRLASGLWRMPSVHTSSRRSVPPNGSSAGRMVPPPSSDFRERPCSAACSGSESPVNWFKAVQGSGVEALFRSESLFPRRQEMIPAPCK